VVRDTFVLFDDVIRNNAVVYSSDEHVERLGVYDQIGLQVVLDQVLGVGSGTFTAQLYHSADGEAWEPRTVSPEIPGKSISVGTVTTYYGGANDLLPNLPFVRASLTITGAALISAHVRLYAVLRDVAD